MAGRMQGSCRWMILVAALLAVTTFVSLSFVALPEAASSHRASPPASLVVPMVRAGMPALAATRDSFTETSSGSPYLNAQAGRPWLLQLAAAAGCAALALRHRVVRLSKGKPQTTVGVRVRKPKNNALRNCSIATYEELTTRKSYEPLVIMYRRRFARPRSKPIQMATRTARRSGHQSWPSKYGNAKHARRYRIIDFGRTKRGIYGTIESIEYDPYRNARLCLVGYEDGEKRYILYAQGFFVGQQVIAGDDAPIFVGNALPIRKVPIGTMVHNIEMNPNDGGRLARAAGTSALILSKDDKKVTVKLPSTEVRLIYGGCYCTIGKVGRFEAQIIKLGKAGKRWHLGWRPHQRGSSKNACDHPHGGGEGRSPIGHKFQMTPFGQCARGLKTRRPGALSNRLILIKRKKKSGNL